MEVYKYLGKEITESINTCSQFENITEIRLRNGCSLQVIANGQIKNIPDIYISEQQLDDILYNMCQKSMNIYEEEISNGYITLKDGHRVGIGGEFFSNPATGKNILKKLKSLNIRISRERIYFENQDILFDLEPVSTLIIGPPHSGKTSLLKIYIKELCDRYRISVCDERKELEMDGIYCDYISGINKAKAIQMATRTLNPQYIICDEIGQEEESQQILGAVNTGVGFICTAHGENMQNIKKRPHIKKLLDEGVFARTVSLVQSQNLFRIGEINDI